MKNYKRLFKFLKGKIHYLVFSLIMVVLIQGLGFLSPLLVKVVIDDCINGIEYPWVEVIEEQEKSVSYNDRVFIQTRDLTDEEVNNSLSKASIVIYKTHYYFVYDEIIDGTRNIVEDNGKYILTIKSKDVEMSYECFVLSKDEVFSFYQPVVPKLFTYIVLIFIKTILVILFSFLQLFFNNKAVNYLANHGRTTAFQATEYLPISYFESEPAGKMASRITSDVDGFIIMYRQLINLFASAVFSFFLAYTGMFILDSKLALLTFIAYPFVYFWIRFFLKKLKKIQTKANESHSLLTAKVNEIINGIQILQIFNFKKQTIKEFNEINNDYMNAQLQDVKLGITGGWNLINVLRSTINMTIVVFFGTQKLMFSGMVITAGLIYAYNEYLVKIIEPISIIFGQISNFENSHVKTERIYKIIGGKQEPHDKYPIERYHGDISFNNVWFKYNADEVNPEMHVEPTDGYVLKGVSFDIKQGEMVGLVGHTGSGKSTLLNLLLRFYDLTDPISGNITIDGKDITLESKRSFRQNIAIVLQEPVMLKGDIAYNIRFGDESITDEQIEKVLHDMGGDKMIKKFPDGIHQQLSRSGGLNMSAGEKQIISLARAIIHNPSILIMDEATSHIDVETESIIKQSLEVANQNRTVIVIAHRLSTVFNADKIIVMDHGLKVEEGTHEELLKNKGVYSSIYHSQVANINNLKNS